MGRPSLWLLLTLCTSVSQASPPPIDNDLDAFMAKVLERRAETWRQLHEYILDETERFELRGPADARLFGQQRQYNWYVRDGYLVRSPVKYNGVTLSEADRRKYEDDWLREEKQREQARIDRTNQRTRQQQQQQNDPKDAKGQNARSDQKSQKDQKDPKAQKDRPATPFDTGVPVQSGIDDLVRGGVEPRFISEAYFLQFKFEPGNYYLVGRERLDSREVVRVEYYPRKRMFDGMEEPPNGRDERPPSDREKDFERKFNKVALVTLWIEPQAHQIVKYTFDNVDFGFLPGRWAVRVDQISATMTMGQPFEGIWLPKEMAVEGGFTLANGGYRVLYGRAFSDYKQGDVRAKIRGYDMREE